MNEYLCPTLGLNFESKVGHKFFNILGGMYDYQLAVVFYWRCCIYRGIPRHYGLVCPGCGIKTSNDMDCNQAQLLKSWLRCRNCRARYIFGNGNYRCYQTPALCADGVLGMGNVVGRLGIIPDLPDHLACNPKAQ